MAVKLFLLGMPGSGKSTTFRHIENFVKGKYRDRSITRIKDYTILRKMAEEDTEERNFSNVHPKGFDIKNLDVLDDALHQLAELAYKLIDTAQKVDVIVVEFSRNDYQRAFKQFEPIFLQDAYFLFLETDVSICRQRISNRANNWKSDDDHDVSDYILEFYYSSGSQYDIYSSLHNVDQQHIRSLSNNDSFPNIEEEINSFVEFIFEETVIDEISSTYSIPSNIEN